MQKLLVANIVWSCAALMVINLGNIAGTLMWLGCAILYFGVFFALH